MWTDDKEIDRAVSVLFRGQILSWLAFALAIFVVFAVLDTRTAIGLTALGWAIHWHLGVNAQVAHNQNLILAGLQIRDRNALGMAVQNGGGDFLEHLMAADTEYRKTLDSPFSQSGEGLGALGNGAALAFDLVLVLAVAGAGVWAHTRLDWVIEMIVD